MHVVTPRSTWDLNRAITVALSGALPSDQGSDVIGTSLPSMSRGAIKPVVLCGLPGDVEHVDDTKNYRNAKVGGQPVLPGQHPPGSLSPGGTVCRNCGKSLVLVAQVVQSGLDV